MPRKKRIWIPNTFYHVVCRGNRRDALFKDEGDFKIFLYMLHKVNEIAPFDLASYCIMTNHFHLQMRTQQQPISKVMSLLNKRYADYYNTKNRITGHVFEKRYYDKIIYSQQDMLEVSRYIYRNPIEANMVKKVEAYCWSSYRNYLHTTGSPVVNTSIIMDYYTGSMWERRGKYKAFVENDNGASEGTSDSSDTI
ncbi:transposase [Radiobacillus sp. PE A8.2]|uniref:transposase n=1 Tax=Radiobacillus sp. PE A8.2 TaxID=3380349 RepID=UPI00388E6AFE